MTQALLDITGPLETREDALRLVDQWMYAADLTTLDQRRSRLADLILEVRRRTAERCAWVAELNGSRGTASDIRDEFDLRGPDEGPTPGGSDGR